MAVLVALVVSMISFGLVHLSGNIAVAIAGPTATSEDIAAITKHYGLDRPIPLQYVDWLKHMVRGDFGNSLYYEKPVTEVLKPRLPITLTLGGSALAFALILAVPLGVLAALRPNSWIDRAALLISVFGQAIPNFCFALFLMLLLGVTFHLLPVSGTSSWKNFVMPAITLGYYATPAFMRLTRTGMLEVMSSDYIRMARAKGLRHGKILFKHALRNAIIPVVSLAAVQLGFMLGGSIIIETIFALNGVGYLAYLSIIRADFPVMQAIVLIICLFYIFLTFIADMLNAYLDPRIRVY